MGLNDVYVFDPSYLKWTKVDENILGIPPLVRYDLAYSATSRFFCLFGGISNLEPGILLCPSQLLP